MGSLIPGTRFSDRSTRRSNLKDLPLPGDSPNDPDVDI
ncbi:MAG: hypothetical protein JWO70_3743 [Betaproteobacteria bacterium]|nr:hypothetical protein [Betaproteobacteria bacterium]